ncbi:hypothetical protein TWF281_001900 [Arthrobotrys megalospora]
MMVSIPSRYDEHPYEFSSVEQKYVYADTPSGYVFNQAPLPKPCLNTHPIHIGPMSDNIYSEWANVTVDGYYITDHQILQGQYHNGYPYETTATLYMTGYHAMEYEFCTGPPNQSGFLPGFAIGVYSSPHGDNIDAPSYPQTAWSPSEPSVASLSPPYESRWEENDSPASNGYSSNDVADEVLQGLGLYDFPEFASDYCPSGVLYASRPGSGRGLKLEESFEFKEEYSDDESDDDEDED